MHLRQWRCTFSGTNLLHEVPCFAPTAIPVYHKHTCPAVFGAPAAMAVPNRGERTRQRSATRKTTVVLTGANSTAPPSPPVRTRTAQAPAPAARRPPPSTAGQAQGVNVHSELYTGQCMPGFCDQIEGSMCQAQQLFKRHASFRIPVISREARFDTLIQQQPPADGSADSQGLQLGSRRFIRLG